MSKANCKALRHLYFDFEALVALAFTYLTVSTVLDLVLPKFIETTHYAGDYWFFGVGAIALSCAGYAALHGARDCYQSGAIKASRILAVVGILLEGFLIIGGILILVEAYRYGAWASQFSSMGIANSGADIRYWVAAVVLAGCVAGNTLGHVLLLSGKDH